MIPITFVRVQLFAFGVNQMDVLLWRSRRMNMNLRHDLTPQSDDSSWNERILIAAVIATMLLSLAGYMHA